MSDNQCALGKPVRAPRDPAECLETVELIEAINWVAYGHCHEPTLGPVSWKRRDDLAGEPTHTAWEVAAQVAEEILLAHIRTGNVRCVIIKSSEWSDQRLFDDVPAPELRMLDLADYGEDLSIEWEGGSAYFSLHAAGPGDDYVEIDGITLIWSDVLRVRPVISPRRNSTEAAPIADRNAGRRPRGRRGRDPRYDIAGFLIEAFRIATSQGLPEVQNDLVRQMLEWCSLNWSQEPSESWAKQYIARVYETMGSNSRTPGAVRSEI